MMNIKTIIPYTLILMTLLFLKCDKDSAVYNVAKIDARGTLCITEVHWAGSIDEYGNNDYPDDDFIELRNYTMGPIDVSNWSIHVQGDYSFIISIPEGTVLSPDEYYTVGHTRARAFNNLSYTNKKFKLPNTPFIVKIKDGGGTTSDSIDFTGKSYLPGGMSLPLLRKSAVRRIEFFGPEPGDLDYNWMTYNAPNGPGALFINSLYDRSVYASPGTRVSGEGHNENE